MENGGVVRISLFFALPAVLALLAAGCGGDANEGDGVALGQGQAGTSVSSGDMGKDIALTTYPTVTGTGGTLPGRRPLWQPPRRRRARSSQRSATQASRRRICAP